MKSTAASLLLATATAQSNFVYLNNFGPFPGYTGPFMNVGGHVETTFSDHSVNFNYELTGVDPDCSRGPAANIPNSCGIHIHSGTSCETPADVGGHFYDSKKTKNKDPWTFDAFYNSSLTGDAHGDTLVDDYKDMSQSLGKVFILHDRYGEKYSCTIIFPNSQLNFQGDLAPYPGYAGDFHPTGEVWAAFVDKKVKFAYAMTGGLDPACDKPNMDVANSCGFHIHEGVSCDEAGKVGGHFYNSDIVMNDPWVHDATYTASGDGSGYGWLVVDYGYDFDKSFGRAMVLHDSMGVRISCTVLMQPTMS